MEAAEQPQTPAPAHQRFYRSCCFAVDKHMAYFVVRSMFGFMLAMFCFGGLLYEMQADTSRTEYISMYFSLLSFVAGYFLGASPRLKRATKTNVTSGSASGSDTSFSGV